MLICYTSFLPQLVPISIAPNCLTFGGFLLNVVSVLLLSWYDFSFYASSNDHPSSPVPPWVWLLCAFNQFMAHTLGKLLFLNQTCIEGFYENSSISILSFPGTFETVRGVQLIDCSGKLFKALSNHSSDGIDGKHARRTGLCGPMGELFDHGLDSWATLFMPLCVYSVFGRLDYSANPWR